MQAFSSFFSHFRIDQLVPIMAIALVCASLSGMLTWLAGPSKGLVLIGRQEGYLPPFLQQVNGNVHSVEGLDRVVVDVDAGEQRESAIVELHRGALRGLDRLGNLQEGKV